MRHGADNLSHRRREQGIAVVLALLVTTLAVTLVASLFWPQQVQLRAQENQRLQTQGRMLLRGAIDIARQTLHQDGLSSGVTTLDGAWALPVALGGLDEFLVRGRAEAAATLSARIVDAQSRYNLANLASGGQVSTPQVQVYDRLLRLLHLDPALAASTARALAQDAAGALPLQQLDDLLAVPGYTPQVLAALNSYAVLLPEPTAVNANTASAEVLSAALDMPLAEAAGLVASRGQAWLRDTADLANRLPGRLVEEGIGLDVRSNYFLVTGSVRLERAALEAQALIRRQLGGRVSSALDQDDRAPTALVWIRQR
jgi:general secretion pathway protein K